MKDLLNLLAQYNSRTNIQFYDFLARQDGQIVEMDAKSYFGSILGILNHIMSADMQWLIGFRDSGRDFPSLNKAEVLNTPLPGWKSNLCSNLHDLRKYRDAVDSVFLALTGETSEEEFAAPITLVDPQGGSHDFIFGTILTHVFNHQTHHRGSIAQILDENGVENDFSNLLFMLV